MPLLLADSPKLPKLRGITSTLSAGHAMASISLWTAPPAVAESAGQHSPWQKPRAGGVWGSEGIFLGSIHLEHVSHEKHTQKPTVG